jgi:hypothetical protein
LNLPEAAGDKHPMGFILWLLFFLGTGYGAYRIIRGGFERSQSERLTGYGIIGCVVFLFVAFSFILYLFE